MIESKESNQIENAMLKDIFTFCEFMETKVEDCKFSKGYNYALSLVKTKVYNMNRNLKTKERNKEK